jgi:hypothetical protein
VIRKRIDAMDQNSQLQWTEYIKEEVMIHILKGRRAQEIALAQ